MRIRMKYLGTGEPNFTTNNDYDVLSFSRDSGSWGVLINDVGEIAFITGITNTANWQLVSVQTVAGLQVYP